MSGIVGGIINTEDIVRAADNERVIKRYSGGIVPPDDTGKYVTVHRDDYISHDYARKLIAQVLYKTEGDASMFDLSTVSTADLQAELSRREGVTTYIFGPENNVVLASGDGVILDDYGPVTITVNVD
ncbi:hypothetical protein [Paenibacillus odorifer]|uniref:Uncharacterized protein n=1 Tax=Paenibacillus odorifer TaxID=189426 RepID=A0A1R0X2Z4_9BACL|nr:hypothetical protein [Paenibacillus odorifer]OMD27488.1 hypothetical protein BJP51_25160 [Paenibacillus odorifer]